MTAFRFIHTSDLHLGRRFGTYPADVRDRLGIARHEAIARLAAAARGFGAAHVLVAGDLFDVETPTPKVWRQALEAMAATGLDWWLLPGNHDNLSAEPLWEGVTAHAGPRVHLLDRAEPVQMAPGVQLLPAPVRSRFAAGDPTAWMDAAPRPEGTLRIGLAHGGVVSFGAEEDRGEVIAPDRAARAGLDYLALGDWHGALRVDARTWYSGSPERDRFKHAGRGVCLGVTLEAPGAAATVTALETGQFAWAELALSLTPEQDPLAELQRRLADFAGAERDTLLRLRLTGRVRLPARAGLLSAVERVRPLYWHLEVEQDGLASEVSPDDLDAIAESGALRMAADALSQEALDRALAEQDRRVAAAALDRLFAIVREAAR